MIDYNKFEEPNLKKWVDSEKESTFGEFSMKVAKRNVQRGKFIVVAVDKGILVVLVVDYVVFS